MEAASQVNPAQADPGPRSIAREDASPLSTLLRRFFPVYCVLAALVTFGYALYDSYQIDGDAVAYMDIGDYLRAHQWAGIVNGYWHPMYPALLALGHALFHATLATELRAYCFVNFGIFLLGMAAVVWFTDAISGSRSEVRGSSYLLDRYAMRYLGLALLVIASQRELSLGKVRPDALLQAFLLFALAALLRHLATGRLRYAALMGAALGCAYLTKSFAFVVALLSIAVLAAFRRLWLKHKAARVVPAALVAFVCFAAVAGPYVAALSHRHGRFDFGDSGSLNYAWLVGGTEKMHLQPYMTSQFGSAEVHLKHPERELLRSPQVLSYAELPYGTYPDWFDATYWNDQIKPHFRVRDDLPHAARNCLLVGRYLLNHPEALLLLALLLVLGARVTPGGKPGANAFWLVPLLLGVVIWGIYAMVNTEERYLTVAYLAIVLSVFAMLRTPEMESRISNLPSLASALVLLLALLAAGESLRTVLEDRRQLALLGYPGGWYSAKMNDAAQSLSEMGVRPGDSVACVGTVACVRDPYWARLAGVRVLTEIYDKDTPLYPFLANLPNRELAIATVRGQGAKVLVGDFGLARVSDSDPFFRNWRQLDNTTLYALPLN
jgi:multisubunit Na+/H+ antiporter MnhF subunit